MLLWSKNIPALEAISDPKLDCIDAVLLRSTIFGRDVLQPKNAARKNRHLQRIAQGRVWRTDDGPPADEVMPALRDAPRVSGLNNRGASTVDVKEETKAAPKSPVTPTRRSRFQEVIVAEEVDEEEQAEDENVTVMGDEGANVEKTSRSPSPAPSLEGDVPMDFPDLPPQEATVRLDGDVRIPTGLGPSFRYEWMGWVKFRI